MNVNSACFRLNWSVSKPRNRGSCISRPEEFQGELLQPSCHQGVSGVKIGRREVPKIGIWDISYIIIYIYHIYINGYMVDLYMANPKSGQRLIAMDLANFFLYIYTVYILCIYIYNICMYVWLCMAMGQVSETEGVAICNYSWTTKGWA